MKEADKYPYDRPDLWEKIQYLPDEWKDTRFFQSWNSSSYEKALTENYNRMKEAGRSSNLAALKKIKK